MEHPRGTWKLIAPQKGRTHNVVLRTINPNKSQNKLSCNDLNLQQTVKYLKSKSSKVWGSQIVIRPPEQPTDGKESHFTGRRTEMLMATRRLTSSILDAYRMTTSQGNLRSTEHPFEITSFDKAIESPHIQRYNLDAMPHRARSCLLPYLLSSSSFFESLVTYLLINFQRSQKGQQLHLSTVDCQVHIFTEKNNAVQYPHWTFINILWQINMRRGRYVSSLVLASSWRFLSIKKSPSMLLRIRWCQTISVHHLFLPIPFPSRINNQVT